MAELESMDAFTYEYFLSQSVFYQVVKCSQWWYVSKKMFNGEFHFKSIGTEKQMWTSGFYRYEDTYS